MSGTHARSSGVEGALKEKADVCAGCLEGPERIWCADVVTP